MQTPSVYLLSPTPYEGTVHLPMLQFELTTNTFECEDIDLLLFTSKQAVRSAESINKKWKTIPTIAIGEATKNEIQKYGGTVAYVASESYGINLADEISDLFKTQKILYLRPQEVQHDIKSALEISDITIKEQILYHTSCINYAKSKAPAKESYIIFTSPSTVKCFWKNFFWEESYKAVAIGKSTAKAFPLNIRYSISLKPTIDSCIMETKMLPFEV